MGAHLCLYGFRRDPVTGWDIALAKYDDGALAADRLTLSVPFTGLTTAYLCAASVLRAINKDTDGNPR